MDLRAEGVTAGYGSTTVVRDVSFTVEPGQTLAIVGRNGAGKTTLLMALMGYLSGTAGTFYLAGKNVLGKPVHTLVRAGVSFAAQEHGIFPQLSVAENLYATVSRRRQGARAAASPVLDAFPILGRRLPQRAGTLSGGETKMLLLARSLLQDPEVMILDEISDGLQESAVAQAAELLQQRQRDRGTTILMVEQNLSLAFAVAQRVAVMRLGRLSDPVDSRDSAARAAVMTQLAP